MAFVPPNQPGGRRGGRPFAISNSRSDWYFIFDSIDFHHPEISPFLSLPKVLKRELCDEAFLASCFRSLERYN